MIAYFQFFDQSLSICRWSINDNLVSYFISRISVIDQDRFHGQSRIRAASDAVATHASRNSSSTIHRKY